MGRPRRLAGIAVGIALVGALSGPATAGPATDRLRGFFADVNQAITDPSPDRRLEDRLSTIRALVSDMIEFRAAARVALGAEWAERTPAQQDEFVRLFADLLQTSVFGAVGGRARLHDGLTVSYNGELADQSGVTVSTTILARSGHEIAVAYRMSARDGAWMVHDVVIDGVSLVENYRAQFHKVMHRSSYAGLVGEMRTRLVELGHGTAVASMPVPVTVAAIVTPAGREAASLEPTPDVAVTVSASERNVGALLPPVEDVALTVPASPPIVAEPLTVAVASQPAAPEAEAPQPVVTARVAVRPADGRPPRLAPLRPSLVARPTHDPAYWVQVGAFRTDEAAIKVIGALGDEEVSLLQMPDTPLLRVLVGPFANRQAAASKLREIRARGLDGFVAELAQ